MDSKELETADDAFPAGTIMLFQQDAPPRGWELVPATIICRKMEISQRPSPAETSS